MDIRPLRVRLDLAKVNVPSYRRYVWYPVSPCALSTIGDLKANICRKFSLSLGEVLLFVDGGLMQDEDTVLLLRENDVVQVVYTSEYQGNLQPVYEDFMDLMPPSTLSDASFLRRSRNLSDMSSFERRKKKKKKKADELNGSGVGADQSSLQDENRNALDQNDASTSQGLGVFRPRNSQAEPVLPSAEGIEDSRPLFVVEKTEPLDFDAESELKPYSQSCNLSPPDYQMEDNGDTVCGAKLKVCKVEEEPSAANAEAAETEKLEAEVKSSNCKKRKRKRKRKRKEQNSTNLSNDLIMGNSQHIKFTDGSMTDQNQTKANESGNSVAVKEFSCSEESGSETDDSTPITTVIAPTIKNELPAAAASPAMDYTQLPSLTVPPPVGTRIAFKILELSELYCPEVSSFKEGTITALHPESENIVIQLAKQEKRQPRIGKFENIFTGQPECEFIQKIILKWTDLIDPRLVTQG